MSTRKSSKLNSDSPTPVQNVNAAPPEVTEEVPAVITEVVVATTEETTTLPPDTMGGMNSTIATSPVKECGIITKSTPPSSTKTTAMSSGSNTPTETQSTLSSHLLVTPSPSPSPSPVAFPITPPLATPNKDRRRRPNSSQSNCSTPNSVQKKEDDVETDLEDDKSIISTTSSTTVNSETGKETPTSCITGDTPESPNKKKKRAVTVDNKSAIVTRKTKLDLIAAQGGRALRKRNDVVLQTYTKRRYVRKGKTEESSPSPIPTTPTKRKRTDSSSSKNQDEKSDTEGSNKQIKMDNEGEEGEDNIVTETEKNESSSYSQLDATDIAEDTSSKEVTMESVGGDETISERLTELFAELVEEVMEPAPSQEVVDENSPEANNKNELSEGESIIEKKTEIVTKKVTKRKSIGAAGGKELDATKINLAYMKPKRGRPKKPGFMLTASTRKKYASRAESKTKKDGSPKPAAAPSTATELIEAVDVSQIPTSSTILIITTAQDPAETVVTKFEDINVSDTPVACPTTPKGVEEPLTVLTVVGENLENEASTTSLPNSEKSESLSPEMESEGVSPISVSQFYKKPEFLENNLGIEKDPKLGEIVKNVDTNSEETSPVDGDEVIPTTSEEAVTDPKETLAMKVPRNTSNRRSNSASSNSSTEFKLSTTKRPLPVRTYRNYRKAPKADAKDGEKRENVEDKDTSLEKTSSDCEMEKVSEQNSTTSDADTSQCPMEEEVNLEEGNETKEETEEAIDESGSSTKCDNEISAVVSVTDKEDKEQIPINKNTSLTEVSPKPSTSAFPARTPYATYSRKPSIDKSKSKWIDEDNEDSIPLISILPLVKEKTQIIVKKDYLSDIKNKEKQQREQEKERDTRPVTRTTSTYATRNTVTKAKAVLNASTSKITSIETKETVKENEETTEDDNAEGEEKTDEDNQNEAVNGIEAKEEINEDSENNEDNKDEMKIDEIKETTDSISVEDQKKIEEIEEDEKMRDDENKENIKIKDEIMDNSEREDEMDDHHTRKRKPPETPETLKQKENHLKSLGLLTHKAAVQAKIEKQRRRELLQSTTVKSNPDDADDDIENNMNSIELNDDTLKMNNDTNSKDNGNNSTSGGNSPNDGQQGNSINKNSQEYTGTLKTVIKLNRQASNNMNNEKRNRTASNNVGSGGGTRQPLKMTFQKGRGRGGAQSDKDNNSSANTGEDLYYTIQNEAENTHQEAVTHGRKSHNRSHTTETTSQSAEANTSAQSNTSTSEKKDSNKLLILIPEKASSFSIHPERLCQDQCYYCGGKFGLYDTPCHVAQIKSVERQNKILENEEKLTVDNCLCDACFRHVDRRANCPSYRKRLTGPSHLEPNSGASETGETSALDNEETKNTSTTSTSSHNQTTTLNRSVCFITACNQKATHSLRRKRLRKTIRKLLPSEYSMFNGLIPICDKHYEVINPFMECALCKRRLVRNVRNHMSHITHDVPKLEKLLLAKGFPVQFHDNPVVCKLCRYFTKLLLKPPEGKSQKANFVKNYRQRLLNLHNIQSEVGDEEEEEASEVEETVVKQEQVEEEEVVEEIEEKKEIVNEKSEVPEVELVPRRRRRQKTAKTGPSLLQPPSEASSRDDSQTPQSSEDGNVQLSSIGGSSSGQIALDNDVLVDYDVPMLSDSPSPPQMLEKEPDTMRGASKLQTILQGGASSKDDISLALRSNPNISMRELFPGEEEMGLQVHFPFGSSASIRTPEGWTRVQTFLQYDEPTRRLWEDLQKPYGNQSSFLRHLILLEKYFRNGDLVLSQNASSNAVIYSESVQNRLHSFDNVRPPKRRKSRSSSSGGGGGSSSSTNRHQNLNSQNNNSSITITTRSSKSTISSNPAGIASTSNANNNNNNNNTSSIDSILKSNLLGNKNASIEILPINNDSSDSSNSTSSSNMMTKQQKLLAAASRLINNDDNARHGTSTNIKKHGHSANIGLPPELISINQGSNSLLIPSKNQNPSSYSLQNSLSSSSSQIMGGQQQHHHQHHHHHHHMNPPKIIKLPDTLTPAEIAQGKNWRPTLMPIKSVPSQFIRRDELYEAVDGRRLPAYVQVQSGHRPYLISIHDYNRMCILRRDKIEQELKDNSTGSNSNNNCTSSSNINFNCNNSNNITATIDLVDTECSSNQKPTNHHHHQRLLPKSSSQLQNRLQIPNKILEQNSLLPISMTNRHRGYNSGEYNKQKKILPKPPSSVLIPIAPKPSINLPQQHQQQQPQMHHQSSSSQHHHQQQPQVQILSQASSSSQSSSSLLTSSSSQSSVAPVQTDITATAASNMVSLIPTISAVFLGSQQYMQQQQQIQQQQQQQSRNNLPKASTSWLWSNIDKMNNGLGGSTTSLNNRLPSSSSSNSSSQLTAIKQQQHNSSNSNNINNNNNNNNNNDNNSAPIVLDSSLLLKIPKSLTVIPQQKGQGRPTSRVNSIEDT